MCLKKDLTLFYVGGGWKMGFYAQQNSIGLLEFNLCC